MIEINLLPWRELRRAQQRKNGLLLLGFMAVMAVAFLIIAHQWIQYCSNKKQVMIQSLQAELSLLSNQASEAKRVEQQYIFYQTASHFFAKLKTSQTASLALFHQLLKNQFNDFYLTEMTRQEKKIILQGIARTTTALSQLAPYFSSNQYFLYAKVVEVKKDLHSDLIRFQVELEQA